MLPVVRWCDSLHACTPFSKIGILSRLKLKKISSLHENAFIPLSCSMIQISRYLQSGRKWMMYPNADFNGSPTAPLGTLGRVTYILWNFQESTSNKCLLLVNNNISYDNLLVTHASAITAAATTLTTTTWKQQQSSNNNNHQVTITTSGSLLFPYNLDRQVIMHHALHYSTGLEIHAHSQGRLHM